MGNPTSVTGGKGGADKTGVIKQALIFCVEQENGQTPWNTLFTWRPSDAPPGLAFTTRDWSQNDDGSWDLTLNYEGLADGEEGKDDAEIDNAGVEDPIETFDKFLALKKKYKGQLDEHNTVNWPLQIKDASGNMVRNPIFRQSHFLNDNSVLRVTFNLRDYDSTLLRNRCKIDPNPRVPKGAERLKETHDGEQWLKKKVTVKFHGNVWQYVMEWNLGMWIPDVYSAKAA